MADAAGAGRGPRDGGCELRRRVNSGSEKSTSLAAGGPEDACPRSLLKRNSPRVMGRASAGLVELPTVGAAPRARAAA
jgi:hypothetical protein